MVLLFLQDLGLLPGRKMFQTGEKINSCQQSEWRPIGHWIFIAFFMLSTGLGRGSSGERSISNKYGHNPQVNVYTESLQSNF